MLEIPPENFTKLMVEYSLDTVSIDELEALYTPDGIIDHCLASIEYLVKDWFEAALMLKELVISSKLVKHRVNYQNLIANSKLLKMSEDWLFKEPAKRRDAVIYVLGKLSDKQYLPILNRVFDFYKNTDPFVMERLMFELGWLGDKDYNDKFNYLANHENFIFRLTCIESVQSGAEQGDQESIDMLNIFKHDPHPAVVAASKDDSYFFNLSCVDCKRDLYDQDSEEYDEQEISVEQFTKWATEKFN